MTATLTPALDEVRTEGGLGAGKAFSLLLVVCGALGLLAAWIITIDKFKLAENPGYTPTCDINPIINCGNIMKSEQAHAFGFPNPMIGLVAYPVVIAIGTGLLSGARYGRWYWLGLQAGTVFGVGFVTWLQYQSLYRIHSLCPWCMLAWAVTIALFWYTAVHNVKHGVIKVPARARALVLEFHWAVPVLWYGIILMLILIKWWWFWSTQI